AVALGLLVVLGCAPGPATSAQAPAGERATSPAGAAAATGGGTAGTPSERPEVDALSVAVAATGSSYLPLQVAVDGGYMQEQGLNVTTSVVSASTAAQALVAGSMDLYQGGATGIAARLGGGDVIYIAAAV